MTLKKCALTCAIAIAFFSTPLIANADVSVQNNTLGYGTAKTNFSPCSSTAGDGGIISPHGTLNIPQYVIDLYCAFGCDVLLYMTKNCSGKKIATVKYDSKRGVVKVDNHNVDGYVVSGGGKSIFIDGGPAAGLLDMIIG